MSDVPVGAYLSGGIDSSAVVALASQYVQGKLSTYSVDFDFMPPAMSELPEARRIAKRFNTDHHEFRIETKHLEDDISSVILQYDEPFADPAALPLHLMAKQCASRSKVVLQGDGGDEVFAGYGRHLDHSQLKMRQFASQMLGNLHPSQRKRQAMKERSLQLNQKDPARRMGLMVNHMSWPGYQQFDQSWRHQLAASNPYRQYEERVKKFRSLDPLQQMLYTDMEIVLPYPFLDKVDKINMYHSIEARVPFLDNDLVNYVLSLPSTYKLRNGVTKSFLREIISDLLPNEILYMRKKSFGTPISEWLRTTLYYYVKDSLKMAQQKLPFINSLDLLNKLEDHKSGRENYARILWRATVLITWLLHYEKKLQMNG
jgi:asparagine synthase (glutamine-hydrolysing)